MTHLDSQGYVLVSLPHRKRRHEHVLIAERALGRPMPTGAQVHHVNGIRSDNRNANLVICDSLAYHKLLEMRTTALKACGHADYRHCQFCKEWEAPSAIRIAARGEAFHAACYRAHRNAAYVAHPKVPKTHCVHGHEFTPENTYTYSKGRACRTCNRERTRAYALRNTQLEREAIDDVADKLTDRAAEGEGNGYMCPPWVAEAGR